MPGLTPDQINDLFDYHAFDDTQKRQSEAVREAAKVFANVLVENTPQSPDQSVAVRKLREVVHAANAAITFKGQF